MDKKELRQKYLNIRKGIAEKDLREEKIKEEVLLLCLPYETVGIYASFNDEVSTVNIIKELIRQGKRVTVPKITGKDLTFYEIKSLEDLSPSLNKYGIPEPHRKENRPVNKEEIEVMIVPGVCFDGEGYRLGYGGGYYDRYLEGSDCLKAGICFKEQLLTSLPHDEHDIKMDLIISA